MPEPTSDGGSGTQTPPQPVTGSTASSGATPQTPTLTLEEAQKRIADLEHSQRNASEELERHRKNAKKLADYEAAEAARQAASLSELEKAQKAAQDAQKQIQQYQEQIVLEKVINAAHKKGVIDPELAALAVKGNLEYGDDGMPSNLDKALDDLIKAKPYLVPKADEPAPASPAQTANRVPRIPAMIPERSSIQRPGQAQPGTIPGWHEVYKRP